MSIKDRFIAIANAILPPAMQVQFRESAGVTVDADEDQWRLLSGDTNRDLSPMTQSRMQKMAHYLWEQNLLANRLIELPVAYLLAEGVHFEIADEDNLKLLNQFWKDPINDMDLKLPKKVRELAIFGEQCYPAFTNEQSGFVRIGYLDPALIETVVKDPDNPEQTIGVVTRRDRKGVARRYRSIINGPEDVFTKRTQAIRDSFGDGEAFYFSINDLSSGSRGRSDLLAQADWLDAYDQFMFGELDRYKFLRSFVWDVTMKGATPEQVKERASKITAPPPGSVRVHNDSEEWDAVTPELAAGDTSAGARLFRNHMLGGATMPETWFGGGGDVNRATAAEMNEPTFKVYSMRQQTLKHMLESMGRYVLYKKHSAKGGAEMDWADTKNDVKAVFPELSVQDTSKYASALQQVAVAAVTLIDKGLLSKKTALATIAAVAIRLGQEIDPEAELKNAQGEAAKRQEADAFQTPPQD
jgi:hypothetical protein